MRDEAQGLGYTVVDASTVIATHISQVLKEHAHEFLGHDEVQLLLDGLAKTSPKLVESLVPSLLSLGAVLKVMQNLLAEGIPVRDVRTIAEALAEGALRSQDPDYLTGYDSNCPESYDLSENQWVIARVGGYVARSKAGTVIAGCYSRTACDRQS